MALSTTTLKTKVADLYGLGGDTTAEADALKALDEAISELNMDLWEFLLSRQESIAMTDGQNYVTLPTLMYKEKDAFVVRTSDGRQSSPLKKLDWATFKRIYGPNITNSEPRAYSMFGEEARVYLGPTPDADTASDTTLTIEYYERLRSATVADADDQSLDVPAEFEVPLLHKARQFYALLVAGPQSHDVTRFQELYDIAVAKMGEVDRSSPDEVTRFRMYDRGFGGRRRRASGLYTRID